VGAARKLKAAAKNLTAQKEAFRYAEQKYNAGALPSADFLTSRNNLTKAESEHIQARFDYIFKLKILEFYKGTPISL